MALLAALLLGPTSAVQSQCVRKSAPEPCQCCAKNAALTNTCCGVSNQRHSIPVPLDRDSVAQINAIICPFAFSHFSCVDLRSGATAARTAEETHSPPPLARSCIRLI